MFNLDVAEVGSLESVETICWRMLSEAMKDRHAGMHQVVVGTVRDGVPMTRVVVLRRVDMDTKKLYFHTDIRKDLVRDVLSTGFMSWLGYDKQLRSQVRVCGKTIVHHKDALAMAHWKNTTHFSRRCYLQPAAPGSESDGSGYEEDLSGFSYTQEESESGLENFAVVETQADWLDWYFTHNRGNRRARFDYTGGNLVGSTWLHP